MWIRALLDAPPRLASLLYWDCAETERILRNRDGALMACLRLRGVDLHSAMATELVLQADRLNNALKRFGAGWTVLAESRRQEVCAYPQATWPEPVSRLVDQERAGLFTAPGQHYETVTTLTLTYKPRLDIVGGVKHLLWEHLPPDDTSAPVERFADDVTRTVGLLQDCCAAVTWLAGADLLTYLHATISPKGHRVQVPEPAAYLNTYLCDTDLTREFVPTTLLRWPRLGEHWLRCITVRAYPRQSYPGMVDVLNTLPLAFRACVRWVPLDRATAIRTARKSRKEHYSMRGRRVDLQEQAALDFANESSDFQAGLQHNEYSAGYLTQTVVVWDPTFEGAKAKAEQVEEALNTQEFVAKIETVNTMAAWQGTLPGDSYSNWRRALMSSWNLAHVFPGTHMWTGPASNPHLGGPCVLRARSSSHTPVNVSLHAGDTGHTGLIGSTGDGKSTFLNFLSLQWQRYPQAEVAIFDKGGAAQVLTHLVGGSWYDLGTTPLQPLARLDRPAEIPWAIDWLDAVLTQEKFRVTPSIKTELFRALRELATRDVQARTMTTLVHLLENRRVKEALHLYTQEGPYGQLVDGATDAIGHDRWLCFELGTVLETPALLNAVLPPLFHRLEQRLTGVPVMYVLHEGWIALSTPYWETRLRAWLKGFRVKNCHVVLASQSLADAVDSPIMPALLDNVVTWILTPNQRAEEQEIGKYYQAIGLNARQRERLQQGVKKRDYFYLHREGQAMVDLALGPVALAACQTYEPDDLLTYAAMYRDDPGTFATRYFAERGVGGGRV